MSNPPYGQNPYGQNPYGQPSSQPSAGWGQPPAGAGNQPPQQPGWGQPAPWGAPQPGPGGPPQQGWGQPPHPGQQPHPGQPPHPGQQPPMSPQHWGPQGQQSAQPQRPVPPTPVPEPEPRTAELLQRDVIVSTTENLPGQEITDILGEVIGVVTRPRDMRAQADLAVILTETRQAAVTAMVEMATRAGADAVIGLRFDGGKISEGASEVTAYGTAVKLGGAPQRASTDAEEKGDAAQAATPGTQAEGDAPQGQGDSAAPGDQGDQPNPFVNF